MLIMHKMLIPSSHFLRMFLHCLELQFARNSIYNQRLFYLLPKQSMSYSQGDKEGIVVEGDDWRFKYCARLSDYSL